MIGYIRIVRRPFLGLNNGDVVICNNEVLTIQRYPYSDPLNAKKEDNIYQLLIEYKINNRIFYPISIDCYEYANKYINDKVSFAVEHDEAIQLERVIDNVDFNALIGKMINDGIVKPIVTGDILDEWLKNNV